MVMVTSVVVRKTAMVVEVVVVVVVTVVGTFLVKLKFWKEIQNLILPKETVIKANILQLQRKWDRYYVKTKEERHKGKRVQNTKITHYHWLFFVGYLLNYRFFVCYWCKFSIKFLRNNTKYQA